MFGNLAIPHVAVFSVTRFIQTLRSPSAVIGLDGPLGYVFSSEDSTPFAMTIMFGRWTGFFEQLVIVT